VPVTFENVAKNSLDILSEKQFFFRKILRLIKNNWYVLLVKTISLNF